MTIEEIKLKFPFPWRHELMMHQNGGLVRVLDSQNKEVPILVMADFLTVVTKHMALKGAAA